MADHTITSLRVPTEFRNRLRAAARRTGKSVSAFIKERLEVELQREENPAHLPSEAERRVLKRFIGGVRHGGLTKDIDKALYGKPE